MQPNDFGCNQSGGNDATPEVRALFEDWVGEVEQEIMTFVKANNQLAPASIAEQLKISEDSIIFFISRLAQQKKIKITGIEVCDTLMETNTEELTPENVSKSEKNISGG